MLAIEKYIADKNNNNNNRNELKQEIATCQSDSRNIRMYDGIIIFIIRGLYIYILHIFISINMRLFINLWVNVCTLYNLF